MNVYGSEVTEATVKRQPEYEKGKPITRQDVGKLALQMIYDEGKRDRALNYLHGLADAYGSFNAAATKCLIYNAIGATMTYNTHKNWIGHIGESSYPTEIKNGQWGAFFHHKPPIIPIGSHGAVVYDLKDENENFEVCAILSWLTAWGAADNTCYAEMVPHVDSGYLEGLEDTTINTGAGQYVTTYGRLKAELTIGADSVSEWTAIISLVP